MSRLAQGFSRAARVVLGQEAHLFLAYAFITFRPGAAPPSHPQHPTEAPKLAPATWTAAEYQLYIDEARLDVANQQAEKRDIRARAQVMLTTTIVLGGAIVASYGSKTDVCGSGKVIYALAALCTALAGLAAGGIISARSDVGTVSVAALPHYGPGELHRAVSHGYAATRSTGAETVATLVTVLRDCVLALVLGAGLLAVAHIWF